MFYAIMHVVSVVDIVYSSVVGVVVVPLIWKAIKENVNICKDCENCDNTEKRKLLSISPHLLKYRGPFQMPMAFGRCIDKRRFET